MPAQWLRVQATAAAVAAWQLARHVAGHEQPFFAPIAAVVALNAALGERGATALRLLFGVLVGIAVGEGAVFLLRGGLGTLALATFVAMAAVNALGGTRTATVQAAGSAILTVAAAGGQVGLDRLTDALIGVSVALLFSQVLFSPDPVALLRRAEAEALTGMAANLRLTAAAFETGDAAQAARTTGDLGDLRERLGELARARRASAAVARRSLLWRSRRAGLVRQDEEAAQLDLLGSSCLLLARAAASHEAFEPGLSASVRALAEVLAGLAEAPGDVAARRVAVERASDAAAENADAALTPAIIAFRMVVADLVAFAEAEPGGPSLSGSGRREGPPAIGSGAAPCTPGPRRPRTPP